MRDRTLDEKRTAFFFTCFARDISYNHTSAAWDLAVKLGLTADDADLRVVDGVEISETTKDVDQSLVSVVVDYQGQQHTLVKPRAQSEVPLRHQVRAFEILEGALGITRKQASQAIAALNGHGIVFYEKV